MPAACKISQTVDGAIGYPRRASSPCIRRWPRAGAHGGTGLLGELDGVPADRAVDQDALLRLQAGVLEQRLPSRQPDRGQCRGVGQLDRAGGGGQRLGGRPCRGRTGGAAGDQILGAWLAYRGDRAAVGEDDEFGMGAALFRVDRFGWGWPLGRWL
jgi:hypothetical protein